MSVFSCFVCFSCPEIYTHVRTRVCIHTPVVLRMSRGETPRALSPRGRRRTRGSGARARAFLFLSHLVHESPIMRPTMLRVIRVLAYRSRLTSHRSRSGRRMAVAGQNPPVSTVEKGMESDMTSSKKVTKRIYCLLTI